MINYLKQKQCEGFILVGIEQTAHSVVLDQYDFNPKTVLVLGNEKEGIPIDIIDILEMSRRKKGIIFIEDIKFTLEENVKKREDDDPVVDDLLQTLLAFRPEYPGDKLNTKIIESEDLLEHFLKLDQFPNIIEKILSYLDGTSLKCLEKGKYWQYFSKKSGKFQALKNK